MQSSLVEDFAYPGAAAILASDKLEVVSGDGHIVFVKSMRMTDEVQCAEDLIQVEAELEESDFGAYFCFRTSGERGFLKLRVPYTFGFRGGEETVTATAELPGKDQVYTAEPGESVPVETGHDPDKLPEAILVELRFGAW
ncbi:hypothetical protein [Cellulomonas sp. NS3]|uniref:hypothetical protein n=1 Tax=Cellulomonas sp. NS3 TaxID=2973977 RepID=UPI002161BF6B|nr:hypothetical protein [Cellulomonas sp. NS3]